MAEEAKEQKSNAEEKSPVSPLAKGYWLHLLGSIGLMIANIAFLVGLMVWSYSVYQEGMRVAKITPDKRLSQLEAEADGGRKQLFVSAKKIGVKDSLQGLSASLNKHRQFYQDLIDSERAFSRLMHLQQNTVDYYAQLIGQSKVWQEQYLYSLIQLPINSAQRENLLQNTINKLQHVPTIDD